MRARYQIEHFTGFVTYLFVLAGGKRTLVSDKMSLIEARNYVTESFRQRGIEPMFKEDYEDGC